VLPFGRDDRVQVASSRTKNRSGSAGLIGQRNERQIAELLLFEASPVAVSDQINVDAVFTPKPKVKDWEDKRGVVAWQQPLAPGESLKFVADYTITYPKDASIAGLP
jgi:hypothetical protein